MPASNNDNGRAFEYACILALKEMVGAIRPVVVNASPSIANAERCLAGLEQDERQKMIAAAHAGAKLILKTEPRITEDGKDTLELSIQSDSQGIAGDVRDVLVVRRSINWEIGLSVKNNHFDAKHSRLSMTIDFGKDWFGRPCSAEYFNQIRPVFSYLAAMKNASKKWSELPNKEADVYLPLLAAFKAELLRLDQANPLEIPRSLLNYLIGRNDFYKIIKKDSEKKTIIQCYNLHGTLNKRSLKQKPDYTTGTLGLPSEIRYFELLAAAPDTTLELMMDANWTVSFRIHNASTLVEPSLKFAIQITGTPSRLFTHHESWY